MVQLAGLRMLARAGVALVEVRPWRLGEADEAGGVLTSKRPWVEAFCVIESGLSGARSRRQSGTLGADGQLLSYENFRKSRAPRAAPPFQGQGDGLPLTEGGRQHKESVLWTPSAPPYAKVEIEAGFARACCCLVRGLGTVVFSHVLAVDRQPAGPRGI